jgi:hypothetical protein
MYSMNIMRSRYTLTFAKVLLWQDWCCGAVNPRSDVPAPDGSAIAQKAATAPIDPQPCCRRVRVVRSKVTERCDSFTAKRLACVGLLLFRVRGWLRFRVGVRAR